jgi:hypothetical protein
MFLASIPISLILGVVVHYLGIVFASIGLGLLSIRGDTKPMAINWPFVANLIGFVFMLIMLFYPFLVGYLDGEQIIGRIGKRGHCRNARIAGLAGAFNGILIYLGHTFFSLIVYGRLSSLIIPSKLFESIFNTTINGTPWWVYTLIIIEFITLVIGATVAAKLFIGGSAYCEKHHTWFGDWSNGNLPYEIAKPLSDVLIYQDVSKLQNIVLQDTHKDPRVVIKMRGCPTGPSCDMEMSANFTWQEVYRNDKGELKTTQNTKPWFNTMLSGELGQFLEEKLQLEKPEPKEKKTKGGVAKGLESQQPHGDKKTGAVSLKEQQTPVCDLCNTSSRGTIVKAPDMSEAIQLGFNPYKEGLVPDVGKMFGQGGSSYDGWRDEAISGSLSQSDWNICDKCMMKLKPYL